MATEAMLREDLQAAMKARDMPTVYVLRGLLAAIANLRIERGVAELNDAELTNLVRSWLADGLNAMGPIMARLKERHAGQYDGRRAAEIVRSILASNG